MNCSEFLKLYSDYRDGCLEDADVARELREHVRECESCMRYDALVCRGVMALRSTGELEPSRRLAFRSVDVLPDSDAAPSPMPAKFAGALMVAAAIALLVWPQSHQDTVASPPRVAQALPELPAPPPRAHVALPEPKPMPAREIDPPTRVFQAQLQPPPEQATIAEWVALPD